MKIWRKRRQLVLGLALGLTAASVLAGPAQAKPDDLEGTLSYSRDTAQPGTAGRPGRADLAGHRRSRR